MHITTMCLDFAKTVLQISFATKGHGIPISHRLLVFSIYYSGMIVFKDKILVVWSNYYTDLAKKQLDGCLRILDQASYDYSVERVEAGTYEIPAVINYFHHNLPYAGYLPLSLLLKGSTDHYEFIWEHIKECFIKFTMEGLLIGNGIISAPSREVLMARVETHSRSEEAFRGLDYLLKLKKKYSV
jgi:6,7-dimethyl-8-ribityllumazine synthase